MMHLQVHLKSSATALSTGVSLEYVEQGDRSGVPVLLLHAYLDSWRSFEGVLAHLPDRVHAFAPSQRGHGESDRPPTGYEAAHLVGDVAAFMDAVGLDAAVLVGSSSAADTVRRFAASHPARTLGLVLVGAFHTFPADAPAVREMRKEIAALTDSVDPDFVREFVAGTAGDAVPPEFLETMVAESRKVPAHVWREMLEGLLAAPPAAGSIGTPDAHPLGRSGPDLLARGAGRASRRDPIGRAAELPGRGPPRPLGGAGARGRRHRRVRRAPLASRTQ